MVCGEPTHEEKKRREEEIFRLLVSGKLEPETFAMLSVERSLSMRARGVRLEHNPYSSLCMCQSCMPGKVAWSARA